jgi:hypothetical protein
MFETREVIPEQIAEHRLVGNVPDWPLQSGICGMRHDGTVVDRPLLGYHPFALGRN